MSAPKRAGVLRDFYRVLLPRVEDVAQAITGETGTPITLSTR